MKRTIDEQFKQLAEWLRISEEAAKEAEALKKEIQDYMAENNITELQGNEHKAQTLTINGTRLDTKRLKAEAPSVYALYTVETVTNRFLFK